ncbi:Phospholipase/carboxylesterase [Schizopora paradoxa]|uniref:Acyl-protein thioesterase 1 n=1 Tax=Schizopora paradoxa TaxID=27342 RepID=A0A0H2S1T4_9AGAM|nr:Phospholipase/carboxylesterase [Schizopora paradoxa]
MSAPIVVQATAKHTATIIFVHGLGDTGRGWKPVADMFSRDEELQHVKWILPHAPVKSITANMGMSMPAWYDIYSFKFDCEEDEKGMLETRSTLEGLIKTEVEEGTSLDRIVLGGFSQGGTMTLLTGLTIPMKLGGMVILSGRLALKNKFKQMASENVNDIPIFWGHGKDDPLVTFQFGKASADFIVDELGVKLLDTEQTTSDPKGLEFHAYEGLVHTAGEEELEDLRSWLKRIIPKQG